MKNISREVVVEAGMYQAVKARLVHGDCGYLLLLLPPPTRRLDDFRLFADPNAITRAGKGQRHKQSAEAN